MNIALCLFGEPRGIEKSFKGIKDSLIDPNGITDIFAHFWFSPENVGQLWNKNVDGNGNYQAPNLLVEANTPSIAVELYKPIGLRIDHHLKWPLENYSRPDYACPHSIPTTQSMACSMNRCGTLLQEYEKITGVTYDGVIFTRPDIILRAPIDLKRFDLSKFTVNVAGGHPGGISDWMGFGNRKVMEHYIGLYHNMDRVFDTGIKFLPEVVLGRWMEDFGKIGINPVLPVWGILR